VVEITAEEQATLTEEGRAALDILREERTPYLIIKLREIRTKEGCGLGEAAVILLERIIEDI
jgi:hypothetical protein